MSYKLLLADDSITIQRVIELTFADEDVQVIAVGDGKQAIDRVRSERPDIVLADVGMPERDGYEVAAFVKGDPEFAHVPVLLLTGAFEPIDESRARSVGCDGVLVKPFEPQMVINRVKDLLAGKRPAGLWSGASTPASPQRPVSPARRSADAELQEVVPGDAAGPGGSLEDYFDRLDAAISSVESGPQQPAAPVPMQPTGFRPAARPQPEPARPAQNAGAGDALADWDPELTGDPSRSAYTPREPPQATVPVLPAEAAASGSFPSEPEATESFPPAGPSRSVAPTHASAAPPLPQSISLADAFAALLAAEQGRPIASIPAAPVSVSEEVIEEIVRRVIDRVGDQAVRNTVIEVAERLVREEIARIKAHAR